MAWALNLNGGMGSARPKNPRGGRSSCGVDTSLSKITNRRSGGTKNLIASISAFSLSFPLRATRHSLLNSPLFPLPLRPIHACSDTPSGRLFFCSGGLRPPMASEPTLIERRYNCDKRRAKQSTDRQSRSLRRKYHSCHLPHFS